MWHDPLLGAVGRIVWLGILALTAAPYSLAPERWLVSLWRML